MSGSRITLIGVALAALLVGVALGSRFRSAPPQPPQAPPVREADRIAELTRELDRERGLRGALELELSMLRDEIGTGQAAESESTAAAESPDRGDAAQAEPKAVATTLPDESARSEWFDVSKLTDLGLGARRAEWLRERFEALQMDELYLRDQAARERWLNKPRYAHELRALREEARVAIGDEDYDSMLYASGRHNRVVLSSVLQNSPAATAGVQAGDVLLRYGDRAIYDIRDLLTETASGELGETVSIDVERDGERLRLYVERGPLGARIQPQRHPAPAGP